MRGNKFKVLNFTEEIAMSKLNQLLGLYDELLISEKVLYDCQTQDLEMLSKFVDYVKDDKKKSKSAKEIEAKKLEDAEAKIFQLEQKVIHFLSNFKTYNTISTKCHR